MKLSKYIILVILIVSPVLSVAQRWKLSRSEYVYGVGVSNYFGDIGGSEKADASGFADIDITNTRPSLSIGYRYKLYERIAVKASLTYANIHGTDVKSINEGRNYSFTTNMFELNGHVEYHITEEKAAVSYKSMSLRGKLKKFNAGINLYVFLGVGGAYFKPKALDDFADSERFIEDKNMGLVVPFGVGLKYPLTSQSYIGLEFGRRFITSDYLDGFSPEASDAKDVYYFTVINVSYKIKRKSKRRPEYRF
ncbi:MAG: hypothetical protein KQH79_03105 [Bacteroidetes bacterium]|nr:hypothetical protein [Bacteroidota bacterium]